MTLGEWLNTWIELYVMPSRLAPSSVAMYNRAVHAVPPWLGDTQLEQLTVI